MNYGLVCISEILKAQDKSLAFKKITRKRFSELENSELGSGLKVLEERILHNLQLTEKIIRHCAKNSISHYRLSSALFPLITDPTLKLQLQKLSNYKDIRNQCEVIGNVAKDLNISLSIHPDQFNVLASEKPSVVKKTINELNFHAKVLDMMGLPQDYSVPINIHPSLSVKNDTEENFRKLVDRFYDAFSKCDTGVRNRLVIENEDKGSWNCANLFMYFYNYCGTKHNHFFPLTYDNLHDHCNPSIFQNNQITIQQNIEAFSQTWPKSFVPVFHWSWGCKDKKRSHADYAEELPVEHDRELKWEVEVKAKDKAIFKMLGQKVDLPTKQKEQKKPKSKVVKKIEKPSSPTIIHHKETKNPFNQLYQ